MNGGTRQQKSCFTENSENKIGAAEAEKWEQSLWLKKRLDDEGEKVAAAAAVRVVLVVFAEV